MPVAAAITYALMTLTTRLIGQTALPSVMALVSIVVFVLGSSLGSVYIAAFWSDAATLAPSLLFLPRPWRMRVPQDFALMLLLGVIATLGFHYLTKAYWIAPVSMVAPFE
jgi:hypothetical protein